MLNRLHAVKDIQDLSQPAVENFSSIINKTTIKSKSIKSKPENTNSGKSKRGTDLGNSTNSPGCSTSGVTALNSVCNGEISEAGNVGSCVVKGGYNPFCEPS